MKVLLLGATSFIGKELESCRPSWDWDLFNSKVCDLTDVDSIKKVKGDYDVVVNCAGWYGGLPFNQNYSQDILVKNVTILAGVDRLVRQLNPRRVIAISSGCVYPGNISDRIKEDLVGSNKYHTSVAFSGMAKLLQLDLMKNLPDHIDWNYLILSNVYGPGEHLDFYKGHVVGSLIKKLLTADDCIKMIGTGDAVRDFFYIGDVHESICRYIEQSQGTKSTTNISSGQGHSIKTLVNHISKILDLRFEILWDGVTEKDGVPYKVLNNSKMIREIGSWNFVTLDKGLENTVKYIKDNS